jgi:hypothetical protein
LGTWSGGDIPRLAGSDLILGIRGKLNSEGDADIAKDGLEDFVLVGLAGLGEGFDLVILFADLPSFGAPELEGA